MTNFSQIASFIWGTAYLEQGFTCDVRGIGHHGSGDLEIIIRNQSDFERAKPLLIKSYEAS
jgi:predicted transport protein